MDSYIDYHTLDASLVTLEQSDIDSYIKKRKEKKKLQNFIGAKSCRGQIFCPNW